MKNTLKDTKEQRIQTVLVMFSNLLGVRIANTDMIMTENALFAMSAVEGIIRGMTGSVQMEKGGKVEWQL